MLYPAFHKLRDQLLSLLAMAFLLLWHAPSATAWGRSGQRLAVNKAIDTLPPELRDFFEANRGFLTQHVIDPLDLMNTQLPEHHNHYLFLDRYGKFPYDALPRTYKAALSKYSKSKLEASGLLPWQIGVYSQKLTEAMKAARWEEAKLDAALLANYVAESRDPFNTTENFDGHLTAQTGINERFATALIDRYASFFPLRPADASFLSDPTDHAFEACLSSHAWLEPILLSDRYARHTLNAYNDEYYDRFYNQAGEILIRQLSEAASDIGSYWLTAWTNAGKPPLPH
jgi:hypothetical protein